MNIEDVIIGHMVWLSDKLIYDGKLICGKVMSKSMIQDSFGTRNIIEVEVDFSSENLRFSPEHVWPTPLKALTAILNQNNFHVTGTMEEIRK